LVAVLALVIPVAGPWFVLASAGAAVAALAQYMRRRLKKLDDEKALKVLPFVAGLEVGVASLIAFITAWGYPEMAARLGVESKALWWLVWTPIVGFGTAIVALWFLQPPKAEDEEQSERRSRLVRRVRSGLLLLLAASLTAMALVTSEVFLGIAALTAGSAGSVAALLKTEVMMEAVASVGKDATDEQKEAAKSKAGGVLSRWFMAVLIAASGAIAVTGLHPTTTRIGGLPPVNVILLVMAAAAFAGAVILPSLANRQTEHWAPRQKGMWSRDRLRAMAFTWSNAASTAGNEQGIIALISAHNAPHPVVLAGLTEAIALLPAAWISKRWAKWFGHHPRRLELIGVCLAPAGLATGAAIELLHLSPGAWFVTYLFCYGVCEVSTGGVWTGTTIFLGKDIGANLVMEGVRYFVKAIAGAIAVSLPFGWLVRVWVAGMVLSSPGIVATVWNPQKRARAAAALVHEPVHPLVVQFIDRWPTAALMYMRVKLVLNANNTGVFRLPEFLGHITFVGEDNEFGMNHYLWSGDEHDYKLEVWTLRQQVVGIKWYYTDGAQTGPRRRRVREARILVIGDTVDERVSMAGEAKSWEVLSSKPIARRRSTARSYWWCSGRRCLNKRGTFRVDPDRPPSALGLGLNDARPARRYQSRAHLHVGPVRRSCSRKRGHAETMAILAERLETAA
jgi:hypothetical protein